MISRSQTVISRTLFAVIGTLALLVSLTTTALASSDPLEGDPGLTAEHPVGYYLWRNDHGVSLRTHGPGDEHHFVARLDTNGVFETIRTVRLESVDDYAVLNGGHTLILRFTTYDWTDGVDFQVRDGTWMRLKLDLNGEPIATDSIYIGADGHHPESNPFVVRR